MRPGLASSFRRWASVVLLATLLWGCRHKKPAPPPPAPAPVTLPPTPEPAEPPKLPQAPKIEPNPTTNAPAPTTGTTQPLPPPQRKTPTRKANAKPAEAKPAETELSPAPQPAAPKLGQMLSADQLRDLNRKLDESLQHVRGSMNVIQKRALTPEQQDILNRIRIFTAQAEQAREQDLVSAVSLAERADLLSRDLLDRLR